MPEDFFHYLWKFGLFNSPVLYTSNFEMLEIIHPGYHNTDSGPDFSDARVRIGNTLWIGNIEIHIRSSDWYRHQHHGDRAYDNVILHVVENHDEEIIRQDGSQIPVLELKNLIPEGIAAKYLDLMQSLKWIPCQDKIAGVESMYRTACLTRVLIERLQRKSLQVHEMLGKSKGNWDEAFYVILARNFGFKINAQPFEMLARSLHSGLIAKYKDRPLQVEALIFGQAGFLAQPFKDSYPAALRKEYQFLRKKHQLVPIDRYLWKYLRLRPQNFPTRRLAQFAAMLIRSNHLFSKILEISELPGMIRLFKDIPVNPYWNNHYRFEECAISGKASMGDESVHNLLINTVAVFLMAFGKASDSHKYVDRSLNLLENLPRENNSIVNGFSRIGLTADNAFTSQALLQLKKCYCDEKKCVYCELGSRILKT